MTRKSCTPPSSQFSGVQLVRHISHPFHRLRSNLAGACWARRADTASIAASFFASTPILQSYSARASSLVLGSRISIAVSLVITLGCGAPALAAGEEAASLLSISGFGFLSKMVSFLKIFLPPFCYFRVQKRGSEKPEPRICLNIGNDFVYLSGVYEVFPKVKGRWPKTSANLQWASPGFSHGEAHKPVHLIHELPDIHFVNISKNLLTFSHGASPCENIKSSHA